MPPGVQAGSGSSLRARHPLDFVGCPNVAVVAVGDRVTAVGVDLDGVLAVELVEASDWVAVDADVALVSELVLAPQPTASGTSAILAAIASATPRCRRLFMVWII
jgi:hypothetical protein